MNASSSRSDGWLVGVLVLCHAVPWTILLLSLLMIVPRYEQTFHDYNLTLPGLTEIVLGLSRWVGGFWFLVPFVLVIFLALDGAVLFLLRGSPRTRALSWAWFVVQLLVPPAAGALCWLGIWTGLRALAEELAR
jgi:hypothetical protein